MKQTIYVIVQQGFVQDVRGVPAGVDVRVRDFDAAGSPAAELDGEEEGHGYRESVYQGRAAVTPISRKAS